MPIDVLGAPSHSTEPHRRDAHNSAEDFSEVALVHEPSCLRNLTNRELTAPEVYLRLIDSASDRILMGAETSAFLKQFAEIMWAHSCECR